jgi:hypothetical protein
LLTYNISARLILEKEMSETHKRSLGWYEDNATEIKTNPDGSVTFLFDEPGGKISSSTIEKGEYEKALKNPDYLI